MVVGRPEILLSEHQLTPARQRILDHLMTARVGPCLSKIGYMHIGPSVRMDLERLLRNLQNPIGAGEIAMTGCIIWRNAIIEGTELVSVGRETKAYRRRREQNAHDLLVEIVRVMTEDLEDVQMAAYLSAIASIIVIWHLIKDCDA